MIPIVSQYAGQQLVTGQQAEVYADDFIAVHLQEIGGGKTYAQLSALSNAGPKAPAAAAQAGNRVRLQEPSNGPCRRTRDSRIRLPTLA